MEWRDQCDSTIRVATQILSRGTPKLGDELAEASQQVLLGTATPQAAAERLEQGLKGWYAPHQGQQAKAVDCQCTAPAASAASATAEVSATPAPSAAISTEVIASSAPVPAPAVIAPSSAASTDVEQALASELETAQP